MVQQGEAAAHTPRPSPRLKCGWATSRFKSGFAQAPPPSLLRHHASLTPAGLPKARERRRCDDWPGSPASTQCPGGPRNRPSRQGSVTPTGWPIGWPMRRPSPRLRRPASQWRSAARGRTPCRICASRMTSVRRSRRECWRLLAWRPSRQAAMVPMYEAICVLDGCRITPR